MDTPPDSQRKAWARLSTLTSFVSRICFFKARCSDSDSVNGFIVIPPAFDFTRVRLGGVKKILSTYLVSRLLRSVWERQANDVFLIGPQHFDLGIQEVRDKLTEISGMRDVIATDL